MKIYKLWQNHNNDYDTYDSCVVIAKGINRAKRLSIEELSRSYWVSDIKKIHAKEIGITTLDKEQIVIASFNAG